MKQCSTCKQTKPFESFTQAKYGYKSMCKDCTSEYNKKYKEKLKAIPKPELIELACSRCSTIKEITAFTKDKGTATGYHCWCNECKKLYHPSKPEKHKERRRKRIAWLRSLKANKPCTDCGMIYEPSCMDYDHLDGYDKIDSVTRMVLENVPQSKVLEEIAKCELVCVFCHNRRTQARLGYGDKAYSKWVQRNIDIINKAKANPCQWCGQQYESFNMQFDHIDSNKKIANICQLKSFKVETLQAELVKCQLLCAACHRRKSLMEQKMGRYPKSRPKIVKKTFIDLVAGKKECTRCDQILGLDSFHKHRQTKSGLSSWCIECTNYIKREKRKLSKEA